MNPIFETQRLLMREFSWPDLENLYYLESDPEVMKYISDGSTKTIKDVENGLFRVIEYCTDNQGLGVWACLSKENNNEFTGWFCLKHLDNTDEIEVGYRLAKRYWNKGYATEGTIRLLDYGFNDLNLKRIVGITHPKNLASQRVLEKAGLQFERLDNYYNCEVVYYAIEK